MYCLFDEDAINRDKKFSPENKKEFLNSVYGDWEIIELVGKRNCKIRCTKCGKTKTDKIKTEDVINKKIAPCNHKRTNDYSGDEWIGKRNGHLTVVGRDGGLFVVRCDCGQQTTARGVDLFTRKAKKSCGLVGCTCSTNEHIASISRRIKGFNYEAEIEKMLQNLGYNAEKTTKVGDFGVDIILTENNGEKTAIQCKKQDDPASVSAIQEVYAGGRFYDCTRFAVICPSGFSNPAIIMARKLGVYLSEGEYNPPKDLSEYTAALLPTFHSIEKNKKYYEINGEKKTLGDWCIEYGKPIKFVQQKMKDGVSLENALKMESPPEKTIYRIGDLVGTLSEIGDYFGIYPQTLSYRMKTMGMTLEEAILATKNIKTA